MGFFVDPALQFRNNVVNLKRVNDKPLADLETPVITRCYFRFFA
jgi:hypothetical protein